jgi:hypothetical protein
MNETQIDYQNFVIYFSFEDCLDENFVHKIKDILRINKIKIKNDFKFIIQKCPENITKKAFISGIA